MKKIICLLLALTLSLTACGQPAAPSTQDYAQVIRDNASEGSIGIVTSAQEDEFGLLELYGLDPDQMERFAVSISPVNLTAYAVMIVLPTGDGAADVDKALQGFIQKQTDAFRDYLPDQYAIAQEAKLVTRPGGERILVMCQDADQILQKIQKALDA